MTDKAEWVRQGEAGVAPLMRAMRWLALNAPHWLTRPLIWVIALWFAAQPWRPATRASAGYLARLGAPSGLAARHRHALTFAHVTLDRVRLLSAGVAGFRIKAEGEDRVKHLHAEGRGAVLLGAHFGSFETLRAFDRTLPGLTVRYLMYGNHAATSTALLTEVNPALAERIIPLEDGPNAMLSVFEALDRGEFVGILGDRAPDLSVRGLATVRFLGGEILVPLSPYIAAMAARVPVILCFAPRLGDRHYAISFSTLYDGAPVPRGQRDRVAQDLAQAYADALAARCQSHPDNWFNFFDIWRPGLRGSDAADGGGRAAGETALHPGMGPLS
ncbi:MAG: hypothetical protein AAFR17_04210 [Pseudomonadota bacterium]